MVDRWEAVVGLPRESPALSLAFGEGRLWAGGPGGLAWHEEGRWQLGGNEIPFSQVSALAWAGGRLFGGSAEGLAVRNTGGLWERGLITDDPAPVAAIAPSPDFDEDGVALAATYGTGILRTIDRGRSWGGTSFGLQSYDVDALAWGQREVVIAASSEGLYRSPNGGRAWQRNMFAPPSAAAAVTFVDRLAFAAFDNGCVARSHDDGRSWTICSCLTDFEPSALGRGPGGALLLGGQGGLLRSITGGETWEQIRREPVISLCVAGESIWVGTEDRMLCLDESGSWSVLTSPPLMDYRWLLKAGDTILVAGPTAGIWRYFGGTAWHRINQPPGPLSLVAVTPAGSLLASAGGDLIRSDSLGEQWETVLPAEAGRLGLIAVTPAGWGWAVSTDGLCMLRTEDDGRTWNGAASLGVQPIVALHAADRAVRALMFDADRQRLVTWSCEDGKRWERGFERPCAIPRGRWRPELPGQGMARLLAATCGIPEEEVLDCCLTKDQLWVLLPGGDVRRAAVNSFRGASTRVAPRGIDHDQSSSGRTSQCCPES